MTMKKIIITTFFKAENYGAALQTYALQEVLRGWGYDVRILNYKDSAIEDSYKLYNLRGENFLLTIRAFISLVFYGKRKARRSQFVEFQTKYMKIGDNEYGSSKDILNNPPEADIYITGSDQVWNSSITKEISDIYTLNFGSEKIYRISYAASIGTKEFRLDEGEIFGKKISKIDAVSVREATAKTALEPFLNGKTVEITLDPVMLRGKREWESDIPEFDGKKEKYILAYQMERNDEYYKIVNALSRKTGLKVIYFEHRNRLDTNRYHNTLCSEFTAGPLRFLGLVRNAEYVVTTSFHGTAFSILFQKKFWAVPCREKGTRIENLVDKLHVSERAVCSLDEFEKKDYSKEIDYEKVNSALTIEREKSLQWLRDALKNAEH